MRHTRSTMALAWVSMALAGSKADAQTAQREPVARLEVLRTAEAMQCPDGSTLRTAVARRLGRDPFSDESPSRVQLVFATEGAGLSLVIELSASDGATLGRRMIRSRSRDCHELAESAAVALVVAIDVLEANAERARAAQRTESSARPLSPEPVRVERPATTPVPPVVVSSTPLRSTAALTSRGPEPGESLAGVVALDAVTSLGDLPTVAGGAALRTGIRWRSLGVFVEGRAMFPTVIDGPQASRIESSLFSGSALGCFHRQWFASCGVVSVGVLLARGSNVDRPRESTLTVLAAGARAAGHWRVPGDFFIDASVEVLGALLRPVLTINTERAWDAPPLQAGLRLGVGVDLR